MSEDSRLPNVFQSDSLEMGSVVKSERVGLFQNVRVYCE